MSARKDIHTRGKKNSKDLNYQKNNKIYLIPIIFILSILPLIIRHHQYNTGLSEYTWFSSQGEFVDFFLYYKQRFYIITCSILIVMLLYHVLVLKNKIKLSALFIPLGVYLACSILSTLLSKHRNYGFTGIFEQFESLFLILGYCLLIVYIYQFLTTEGDLKLILKFFTYGILILGLIGTFQAFGFDFFATTLGGKLITQRVLWDSIKGLTFNFGKYCSYLTLYNPNYVGVYVAMVLPLLTCLILVSREKKAKILYIIIFIEMVICLYGSKSNAGLAGIVCAIGLLIVFFRKYIFNCSKYLKYIVLSAIVLIIIGGILNREHVLNSIKSFMAINNDLSPNLSDIQLNDEIIITYKGEKLKVTYDLEQDGSMGFNFRDDNNKNVSSTLKADNSGFDIADKRFQGINVCSALYENNACVDINIDQYDWVFMKGSDGKYKYLNYYGKLDDIVKSESAIFTNLGGLASGRGYLWSRTIPLLKKYPILGSGADTFALVFPHQDYVNLYKYGFGDQVVTKPHSLYLQIGVQTGVLSLVAFIVFYLMYFISSIRLFIKGEFNNILEQAGVSIFIGTVTYMITGLTNDSCIAVSPVFWSLLGIGIAINHLLVENNKKNPKIS